jgi:CcmD family protein
MRVPDLRVLKMCSHGSAGRRAVAAAGVLVLLFCATGAIEAAPQQPPVAQDEFVPLSSLPQEEQLPAAPLLLTAYAFVWVALLVYVLSIWRRLSTVEREIGALRRLAAERERRI